MKRARNFIGAVAIASAFMLSPAPLESASVESLARTRCIFPPVGENGPAIVVNDVSERVQKLLTDLFGAICLVVP